VLQYWMKRGLCRCGWRSPPVLNMWLQTVKFIAKKSKFAGLAQQIGFSAPNSWSLPWLVRGTTQLCTSKIIITTINKENNWQ
jgi:hypothetical protein